MILSKVIYLLFTLLSVLAISPHNAFANKMYRWVDEHNNVIFSDQMPPDQIKHKRETLNKNARVIKTVEQEKTKAQQELEKRLNKLRQQQQIILDKQKVKDKVLLSTFRNLNDMKSALKAKMQALDGQNRVVQGNLNRLKSQLKQQQQAAAQYERDGKAVPVKITNDINSSNEQIDLTLAELSKQSKNKRKFRKKLENDIGRFVFLTQSKISSTDITRKTAESKAETELGVYICITEEQCNKAWKHAKEFVNNYSTTGLYIETDVLIMSKEPSKETDLSLSASKKDVGYNKQQLFLDIRCHISSLGKELCNGPHAKNIRHSFSNYIKSGLLEEI